MEDASLRFLFFWYVPEVRSTRLSDEGLFHAIWILAPAEGGERGKEGRRGSPVIGKSINAKAPGKREKYSE